MKRGLDSVRAKFKIWRVRCYRGVKIGGGAKNWQFLHHLIFGQLLCHEINFIAKVFEAISKLRNDLFLLCLQL